MRKIALLRMIDVRDVNVNLVVVQPQRAIPDHTIWSPFRRSLDHIQCREVHKALRVCIIFPTRY